ncbi:VOC family protein [Candidatus Thiosymbion oneisti]|nr:VOC family protein [Candidatus Thiosymbion oneisti]
MKKLTPNLMVADVVESIRFYVDLLGFSPDLVVPENERIMEAELQAGRKYAYAVVHRDEVFVMFMRQDEYRKDVPAFSTMDIGASVSLYIDMENVESFYDKIKDKVRIEKELADTWYGMREFYICDNNGYILAFGEPIPCA